MCVYILGSVHTSVICVIKHSQHWEILMYIYVFIQGSIHIAAVCAIKHSAIEVA